MSRRARPVLALTANMSARLADILERCLPSILHEWELRAAAGELRAVCQSDRAGDLADVLRAICTALQPDPAAGAIDAFIEVAAAHGARRRVQGVHEACLFEEYDFLGTAVPHALRECRVAPLTPEDLLTLEGALTTAILAGLRGYHRGEFERRGIWADVLARTARDSTDLGPASADPR
ncbi:MAG TPA: hypothetical protein VF461_02795 [Gemmatimonadaceae bacterium]